MKFPIELENPLVVFDIESTGTSPRKDRIIELAAVKVERDGTETSKCWLLNPTVHIPEETTAFHGISDEDVKDCPTFAERAEEIFEFFRGCDISGFNADRFDIPCIEEEFARCGMNFGSVVIMVLPAAACGNSSCARCFAGPCCILGTTSVSITLRIKVDLPVRTGPTTPI